MITAETRSLSEVHSSVSTTYQGFWRRLFAFAGPAYLVSVGYMDPGNWATDLEGGARFGYQLLWVLVLSNAMAILLQTLSARLGIVCGRDLAQACRESYPKPVTISLWILCEIAIAACDLAEVIGAAIALQLLFGLPLLAGVMIGAFDTLLVLWLTRINIRFFEAMILTLIAAIGICFSIEVYWAKPDFGEVALGLIPHLNPQNLYIAIGILGATVMPHNLYLHSALVQTRQFGDSLKDKRLAAKFNLIDSAVALNASLFVNAAILIVSSAVFFKHGIEVTQIQQAHLLLSPLLGVKLAGVLFAVALFCSGQSSTLTGTMAGQIVMEGFLNFRVRPWLRRLITRSMAVIPAVIVIYLAGEGSAYKLLILSQVILSLQLPFAVVPLIHFTSDASKMGELANAKWVKILAWLCATIIIGLNGWLVVSSLSGWLEKAGSDSVYIRMLLLPILCGICLLLVWILFAPILPSQLRRSGQTATAMPASTKQEMVPSLYRTILVPLDHSGKDAKAISHAAAFAIQHNARLLLMHVEEDVPSQLYGTLASTAEVEAGRAYIEGIVRQLDAQAISSEVLVRYSNSPADEIIAVAKARTPDLIIMGSHGHRLIGDLVKGHTINIVRHALDIPILIVK